MNTELIEDAGFVLPLPAQVYIDTIRVLFPTTKMAMFRKKIPALGQLGIFHDSKMIGHHRIDIQLPKVKAPRDLLKQLAKYQARYSLILSKVDVACDVSCDNFRSASLIQKWLDVRVRQRWAGSRIPVDYDGTRYTSNKSWNDKSIVTYSDKPSKLTGRPCAHVELRMKGASKVLASGIDSLKALAGLNLVEFMYGQLHFEEIRYEALGRIIRKRSRAKKPDIQKITTSDGRIITEINRDLRAGYLIARQCGYLYKQNVTQKFWSNLDFALNDIPAIILRRMLKKHRPTLRADSAFKRLDAHEIFDIQVWDALL